MSKISNSTAAEAKTAQHVAEQNVKSTPNAGTTGEHADCDETLQKGHAHKKQTEFDAKEVKGAAKKATQQQVYGTPEGLVEGGHNPKHRLGNTWGIRNDESEGRE